MYEHAAARRSGNELSFAPEVLLGGFAVSELRPNLDAVTGEDVGVYRSNNPDQKKSFYSLPLNEEQHKIIGISSRSDCNTSQSMERA